MKRKAYISLAVAIGIGAGLLYVMINYSPAAVGPFGIIAWFIGLLLFLGALMNGGYILIGDLLNKKHISPLTSLRRSFYVAFITTFYLASLSIGMASLRDVALLSLFFLLIEVYITKKRILV